MEVINLIVLLFLSFYVISAIHYSFYVLKFMYNNSVIADFAVFLILSILNY